MENIKFMTSLLTFYLKGEISVDDKTVKLKNPNTILGLIPLGFYKRSIPVTQISTVEESFKLKFKSFLIGLIITFGGFSCFSSSIGGGIIFSLLGIGILLGSFESILLLSLTSGKTETASFFIFEKNKALQAEELINNTISGRLDDTNVTKNTDRVVDAMKS